MGGGQGAGVLANKGSIQSIFNRAVMIGGDVLWDEQVQHDFECVSILGKSRSETLQRLKTNVDSQLNQRAPVPGKSQSSNTLTATPVTTTTITPTTTANVVPTASPQWNGFPGIFHQSASPTSIRLSAGKGSQNQLRDLWFKDDLAQTRAPGEADYQAGNLFYIKCQYKQSLPYFEKSAKENYPAAYLRLWWLYGYVIRISEEDTQKKKFYQQCVITNIDWFQAEAKKGGADAQTNLAECYVYGLGKTKEFTDLSRRYELAMQYYQLAADQKFAVAEYGLGKCYENTWDLTQAVKYYQLAANQGHSDAQYDLAVCYKQGKGVKRDLGEAVKYYQLAADQGNSSAQYSLGICYQRGSGTNQDDAQAVKYFQLAANQEHADAQLRLETLLEKYPHLRYPISAPFSNTLATTTTITATTTNITSSKSPAPY